MGSPAQANTCLDCNIDAWGHLGQITRSAAGLSGTRLSGTQQLHNSSHAVSTCSAVFATATIKQRRTYTLAQPMLISPSFGKQWLHPPKGAVYCHRRRARSSVVRIMRSRKTPSVHSSSPRETSGYGQKSAARGPSMARAVTVSLYAWCISPRRERERDYNALASQQV